MVSSSPIPRLLKRPAGSFFLFGPRGTGKSTWLRTDLAHATWIDLLDESLYQTYLADPAEFAAELRAASPGSWVVVDEVQRLPSLLNEVHRAIEQRRLKFALSGSSARKLRRGGTNLLGGRAITRTMFPFVPEELGSSFDLNEALAHGTLPLVLASDNRKQTLTAYVQTYLKQEIQAEAAVRNLPGFARFLPVAALFHGQTLNVASLSRDAGVQRTTVTGYVEILEDTLIATRLAAFEGKLRVRERKHPKLFFFDPGVVRALKHQLGAPTVEERGPLLEGFVLMLLRFYQERGALCDDINYWAPAEAHVTEVDFVLRRAKEMVAIEVKTAKKLRDADLRGLRAVQGEAGVRRRIAVYLGDRRLETPDGIEVWPFGRFADALANGTV
jgi:uncharacterized protein